MRSRSASRQISAQLPADEVVVPEPEGALHGRRRVFDAAVAVDDHDDVGGVADQRGEPRLDQVDGPALANLRVVPEYHALPGHDEDGEHEDRNRHDGDGAAAVARREVHQHEEGQAEAGIGDDLGHRAAARVLLPLGPGLVADLDLGRACDADIAGEVEDVGEIARQVVARNDRGRPDDVGEEHHAEAAGQHHERRLAQRAARAVHEQHADRHEHQAVERDVDLRQHEAREFLLARRRGRADDEEPEERAEAEDQDRRIEQQPAPGHAQRTRANGDDEAGEKDGKE